MASLRNLTPLAPFSSLCREAHFTSFSLKSHAKPSLCFLRSPLLTFSLSSLRLLSLMAPSSFYPLQLPSFPSFSRCLFHLSTLSYLFLFPLLSPSCLCSLILPMLPSAFFMPLPAALCSSLSLVAHFPLFPAAKSTHLSCASI